jgi:hypothetical protein
MSPIRRLRTATAQLLPTAIDAMPAWIWRPGNLRFVGSNRLHFCIGWDGRRTVEWNDRPIAVGRRAWRQPSDIGPG